MVTAAKPVRIPASSIRVCCFLSPIPDAPVLQYNIHDRRVGHINEKNLRVLAGTRLKTGLA